MILPTNAFKSFLPNHQQKTYGTVGCCIYCGSTENLGDEHIIPFGLGGRALLPKSSCKSCEGLTSKFERTCLRTMFGPLRMFYDLPTRRKDERPEKLPLKVKLKPDGEWTPVLVDQQDYPFLFSFPHFQSPDLLSGQVTQGERGAKSNKFWIRGAAASREGFQRHLDYIITKYKVFGVYPEGKTYVEEFCLLLAKVAHSYATAEIGYGKFEPLLINFIIKRDLVNRVDFIGELHEDEPPSLHHHELSVF